MDKSTVQFTPGPWASNGLSRVIAPDGRRVAEPSSDLSYEEAVANARLIAAAPELYAALDRVLKANCARAEWPDNDATKRFDAMLFECELAESAANAALAKARGEQ